MDGVYTRGAVPCPTSPLSAAAAAASCEHVHADDHGSGIESTEPVSSAECISQHTPVTDSIAAVSSHSSATTFMSASTATAAADVTASLSLQAAVQLPGSPPQCSPPVKTGILPPAANANVDSTSVGASSSAAQTNRGWKEFEEALCEQFVPLSSAGARASSHQTQFAMTASYTQQQPLRARVPSFMMPSMYCICLHFASGVL